MITQRFNTPKRWNFDINHQFIGFIELLTELSESLNGSKMIEIGSYMGESTMLFASTKLFDKIYSIEPHSGFEEFNQVTNFTWEDVKKEYKLNTRFFNNIEHIKNFSYNVVDMFDDDSIDFIYIDGRHDYESVKLDLELYLPKLKNGGIIGGHDYNKNNWPEVCRAVNEVIGEPHKIFKDSSWIYKSKHSII